MSAIDNTPKNTNFLSPLNFRFNIKKAPHVNFFIQEVNIPDISIRPAMAPNPFVTIPNSGEHIAYSELSIKFKVDEDLTNYLEIHNWIKGLGKPDNFNQYKELQDKPSYTGDGIISDISVIILSNNKNPNFEVIYKDAFPVSISELKFNTTEGTINYLTASANFRYVSYEINKII